MKILVRVLDIDGTEMAEREFLLDEYTSRHLGSNTSNRTCPTVEVSLIHEEHLATLPVKPGIRPGF